MLVFGGLLVHRRLMDGGHGTAWYGIIAGICLLAANVVVVVVACGSIPFLVGYFVGLCFWWI